MTSIAIFCDVFPTRSETFVLNQVVGLLDQGLDVKVLCIRKGDTALLAQPHIEQYQLESRVVALLPESPQPHWRKLLSRLRLVLSRPNKAVFKALFGRSYFDQVYSLYLPAIAANNKKTQHFDWMICHFGHNGVLASRLKKIGVLSGDIATIFHGADISSVELHSTTHQRYAAALSENQLYLPISTKWKDKLIDLGFERDKIYVHRMGVDLSRFEFAKTKLKTSSEPLRIFTAARFCEKKGLRYALDAIAEVCKSISNVQYTLGGFGPLEAALKRQVELLDISKHVKFVGAMTSEEVCEALAQSDIYLLPSVTASDGDMEGVPVALMEAMASGVPVVSTQHSGIPELITHGVDGFLAPEKDSRTLAKYLIELAQNPTKHDEIRYAARNKVVSLSDQTRLDRQLTELLEKIPHVK